MNGETHIGNLGVPNIRLSGVQIWIHSRQFPDSNDFWDGNWLNVTVHCGANGASVWTSGAILHVSEIADWLVALEKMNGTLSGEANLDTIEPEFNVKLKAESLGQITMKVEISPNHLTQRHSFKFEVDQSYIDGVIKSCRNTLAAYPLIGKPSLD
jgi:hypothetical protein